MSDPELCFLSVTELGSLLRSRRVSPVEVVQTLLTRIDAVDAGMRAYVHVCREQALAAARAAEIEIGAGLDRGPLHGIPVAYKDIYDVRGLPTTAASRLLLGSVASEDSTVAARLRQAGAICLGKLNTFEFASGSMDVFGPARNPWNPAVVPGGSSAGSGVALAAGLIPLATGSDTGGSIRIPAAYCGVVGLRPTFGRVSRAGIIPLSWSLDHAGPMARTVTDTALFLQAMAGPDPRDSSASARSVPAYAPPAGDLAGMRLGVPRSYFFEGAHGEVVTAVDSAVNTMRQLGAVVREVNIPHARYGSSASWAIAYSEAFAYHRAGFFARAQDYTPAFLHKITGGGLLSAEELITAQRVREVITAEFLEALRDVDALVTPTMPYPAHHVDATAPEGDMRSLVRPVSLTGLPALALPCGFTRESLPVSLQLIGRAWAEGTLLRIGHTYEQATPWHVRRPAPSASHLAPAPLEAWLGDAREAGTTDGPWVMDQARLMGLTFVRIEDAGPVAASIGPARAQLAEARAGLERSAEPPVRAAPA
jgi:aspartyl-tRNA(Asn)/glutamyl-tRNA(Gln) amidotransferase subunit A